MAKPCRGEVYCCLADVALAGLVPDLTPILDIDPAVEPGRCAVLDAAGPAAAVFGAVVEE